MARLPTLVLSLALLTSASALAGELTVYRCVDAKGRVTLRDDPCDPGQQQSARTMTKPVDAPPKPAAPKSTPPPAPSPVIAPAPPPARIAPPPLYECTSYDGIVRESESYDPNPRCEPIVLYYPQPQQLPPSLQTACRWVEDSCVRLSEVEACARFEAKHRKAQSDARHAFSDTAAYRKSELQRLRQLLDESCR